MEYNIVDGDAQYPELSKEPRPNYAVNDNEITPASIRMGGFRQHINNDFVLIVSLWQVRLDRTILDEMPKVV
jgi:hypothetical protein